MSKCTYATYRCLWREVAIALAFSLAALAMTVAVLANANLHTSAAISPIG